MPGNVIAAQPQGVLPKSLSTSFTEMGVYPILDVPYHDGSHERSLITDTVNIPRKVRTWRMSKRLNAAQFIALKNFYEAHLGGVPFYFYPFYAVDPGLEFGSNYDPSGADSTSRVCVYFSSDSWEEVLTLSRTNLPSIELKEVDDPTLERVGGKPV